MFCFSRALPIMAKNTIGITRNKINLNVTTTRRRTNARIPAMNGSNIKNNINVKTKAKIVQKILVNVSIILKIICLL